MEPTDLTVKILQELRDGQEAQTLEVRGELRSLRDELRESHEQANRRFDAVETALRELADEMTKMTCALHHFTVST